MKIVRDIDPYIFRGYDIRGIAGENLTEDVAYTIGLSFGTKLANEGKTICVVGRDNRLSSPMLANALITGILETGTDVVDLGVCTTPMYYYACINNKIESGIMVTASHNPKRITASKLPLINQATLVAKIFKISKILRAMLNLNKVLVNIFTMT